MDLTPLPRWLKSQLATNLGWHDSLAELIDNAFDQDANRVEVSFSNKTLTVKDDGQGCTNLQRMVRLGDHHASNSTQLGMYGRGLKDAWLWFGEHISITSFTRSGRRTLEVNLATLLENNWQTPDGTHDDTKGRGTVLRFDKVSKSAPRASCYDKLCKTFMPALADGRQIVFSVSGNRPIRLKAFKLPVCSESISFDVAIDGGKSACVSVGVVEECKPNPTTGLFLIYGHRVLQETAAGVGRFSCSRLTGTIKLSGPWKLTPNKTGLHDSDFALLDAAMSEHMHWIAQKAHQQSVTAESEAFVERLQERAKGGNKGILEKRNQTGESQGTAEPANSGKKRKRAEKTDSKQAGSVTNGPRRRRPPFQIDTYNGGASGPLGKVDDNVKRVSLNIDHSFISSTWQTNEDAILAVVFGLYCSRRFSTADPIGNWSSAMTTATIAEERGKEDAV